MGGIVQQINLYQGRDSGGDSNTGARLLLWAGGGALVAVLLLAIAGEMFLSGVSADRTEVAGTLQQREVELAKFKEKLVSPGIDPFLKSELQRLHDTKAALKANLRAIERQAQTADPGFSEFFAGLARNTLKGLWFNKLGLSAGGAEMLLQGQTLEPALVPRLLQTLAAEQAFAGRTFRKVSFERLEGEAGSVVDFELRSAQPEEISDAG